MYWDDYEYLPYHSCLPLGFYGKSIFLFIGGLYEQHTDVFEYRTILEVMGQYDRLYILGETYDFRRNTITENLLQKFFKETQGVKN